MCAATTTLAGCGKKGPLEPPAEYAPLERARKAEEDRAARVEALQKSDLGLLRSTSGAAAPANGGVKPLNPQPFFLDPLL